MGSSKHSATPSRMKRALFVAIFVGQCEAFHYSRIQRPWEASSMRELTVNPENTNKKVINEKFHWKPSRNNIRDRTVLFVLEKYSTEKSGRLQRQFMATAEENELDPSDMPLEKGSDGENQAKHETKGQPLGSERIRDNWGPLLGLTRPKNFPAVVIFHMVGVYLALASTSSLSLSTRIYWETLITRPTLWLTLLSLLLVDSTSMVTNDYYDAKMGRDAHAHKQETTRERALVSGRVSFQTTKRFVSYLYAVALVLVAFLPGITTRLSVVVGLMLTYLYTQHMKPVTWLKNVVCASLIALSPWTSGSAALHTVFQTDRLMWRQLAIPSLWRLVGALFAGVFSREMLMDCNDLESDRDASVRTVPVVHGQLFASKVAFASTLIMCLLVMFGPAENLMRFYTQTSLQSIPWQLWRRFAFGSLACIAGLRRGWTVVETEGKDPVVIQRAVDEGLLAVLLLLFSFL